MTNTQTEEQTIEDESPVDEETRKFYINSLMHDVETIKRKSFRRLILLRYIIEYEGREVHGPAWESWCEQKESHVTADFMNFIYALDVSMVREMKPTAYDLCSESDVEFLYDVSDDTLREYIKVLRALLA